MRRSTLRELWRHWRCSLALGPRDSRNWSICLEFDLGIKLKRERLFSDYPRSWQYLDFAMPLFTLSNTKTNEKIALWTIFFSGRRNKTMLCQLCELLFLFYLAIGKVPLTHGCFIIFFFFCVGGLIHHKLFRNITPSRPHFAREKDQTTSSGTPSPTLSE